LMKFRSKGFFQAGPLLKKNTLPVTSDLAIWSKIDPKKSDSKLPEITGSMPN